MSTWVGMGPVIGPGSLDGFAIGVMMSGAVFMAVTAQRRTRRRPAVAGGPGMLAGPHEWLSGRLFRRSEVPRISRVPRVSEIPQLSGASAARAFDADALEPDALEPGAFEAGAFEPGAFEAGAFEPGAFEAGAFGPSPFGAGPFAAGAERLARPDEPEAYSDTGWHLSVGDDGRVAGGHRSRHRLNEPLPGTMSPDRTPRGGTSPDSSPRGRTVTGGSRRPGGGFPDSAFPESAFPERDLPENRFPDVSFPGEEPRDAEWLDELPDVTTRDAGGLDPLPDMPPRDSGRLEPAFPDWASGDDAPFPDRASREDRRPDVEFPDVAFPDGTFGTSKRPESRRLPRHAAPAVGLGSKVSHWMNGLFASGEAGMGRWAGSGARS